MITSDHGEPFGEHGFIRKCRPECHEDLTHIPWIVRHPDGMGAGKRFRTFVQPPDLMPTVLEVAGFDMSDPTVSWDAFESEPTAVNLTGESLVAGFRHQRFLQPPVEANA